MEKRFSEVNRIADLVWEKEKIIFEIQCSRIPLQEVKNRKKDYQNCGYSLVWILLDRHFNRSWLTHAEIFLRSGHCYFTNGRGQFYDQVEIIKGRRRLFRGHPLPISLSNPIKIKNQLHFSGDAADRKARVPVQPKPKNFYLRLLDSLMSRFGSNNF
ncbi:MAG: competence protein CoiA family protein [Candidatus Algichlamydia australiensis]|nr:competence protein CoiA family protein [Chlamydiales bacterium]